MKNILIIDGHDRRALATVRSLGKKRDQYRIFVGSKRKINATRFSKYCDEFVHYPDPVTDTENFVPFLADYIQKAKIDVLVPMDDTMAEIVARNGKLYKSLTNVLIPDWEIFSIARDKALTLAQAVSCGIPIPPTYTIEEALANPNLTYPIIIKPRISSASIGMVVANDRGELKTLYDKVHKNFPLPIIQEKIKSGGGHFQANVVFDRNSDLVCSSVKNKLREFPLAGGPSTFFRTVDNAQIEEYGIRLLKSINWVGPAEVEFMIDPLDNQAKLMEINPRMSATIVLSVFAGVDFPEFIVSNALRDVGGDPVRNKNFNHYCQWLIPGDFLNFLFNKDRFKQPYGYFFGKPEKLCHMTYDSKDLKPFVFNLAALGLSALNPKKIFRFIVRG